MAASRITCPDCKSVLKPAKPVPDGKRVKCPKCGNVFTTPGLIEDEIEEEEERPRRSKASGKKKNAGIKKAVAPKPAPKKPADDDDDESGGGIYSYVQEGGEEDAEDEKPDIEYAPDMSIKDLRGPAQAALVRPSNWLLLIAGLGCVCDFLIICVMVWPFLFTENIVNHADVLEAHYKKKGTKEAADKIKNLPKELKDVSKEDMVVVDEAKKEVILWNSISAGVYFLMLIYNGITCMGAVKMQNLESRGWSLAASIMTLLPFGAAGLGGLIGGGFFYTLGALLFDEPPMQWLYSCVLAGLVYLGAIGVGVWSLRTLLSQEVIDGFEYVAD